MRVALVCKDKPDSLNIRLENRAAHLEHIRASGVVEMAGSRDKAMCCGGGGARVWLEEEGDVRVNRNRLAHIQATGASQAAVACPFCLIMLEDARGALDAENLVIRDVAEIVAEALVEPAPPDAID